MPSPEKHGRIIHTKVAFFNDWDGAMSNTRDDEHETTVSHVALFYLAAEEVGVSPEQIATIKTEQQARQARRQPVGLFDLAEEIYPEQSAEIIQRYKTIEGDNLYGDAVRMVERLSDKKESDMVPVLFTAGFYRSQQTKMDRENLPFPRKTVDDPNKGKLLTSYIQPDGTFRIPLDNGDELVAEYVILVDDNEQNFEDFPEKNATGFLMKRRHGRANLSLRSNIHLVHSFDDIDVVGSLPMAINQQPEAA